MELIFATHNPNKVKEISSQLGEQFELISLAKLGLEEEIEETERTLEGNALLKAKTIKQKTAKNCFADDTGLEVEALNGAPGVYSARYAGENCSPDDNIDKLLAAMKDKIGRKARFRTVIALIISDKEYLFEGICDGEILYKREGKDGFGYDPVFRPNGYNKSFAQMSLNEKNKISHRGLAVKKLIEFLLENKQLLS